MKPRAATVIQCITKRVGAAHCQTTDDHLLEGMHTDLGCNYEAIAINE